MIRATLDREQGWLEVDPLQAVVAGVAVGMLSNHIKITPKRLVGLTLATMFTLKLRWYL